MKQKFLGERNTQAPLIDDEQKKVNNNSEKKIETRGREKKISMDCQGKIMQQQQKLAYFIQHSCKVPQTNPPISLSQDQLE